MRVKLKVKAMNIILNKKRAMVVALLGVSLKDKTIASKL